MIVNAKHGSVGFVLIVLMFLFLTPIRINLLNVGNKPVDLVFSDVIVLFGICAYFIHGFFLKYSKLELQVLFVVFFSISFFLILAFVGYLETGVSTPILSSVKYVKPMFAVMLGLYFSKFMTLSKLWRSLTLASLFVLFGLIIGQVLVKGGVLGRWGEYFFFFDVYGFPNSTAQYYVMLEMFAISGLLFYRYKSVYFIASILIASFVIFSLSRSGFVILVIFFLILFQNILSTKQKILFSTMLFLIPTCVFIIVNNSNIEGLLSMKEGVKARVDRTFSSDDPSSGRFEIVNEAIQLIIERPVLGYKFDSFNHYHKGHSTPHNQYIEGLFKTGIVGFLIYYGLLLLLIIMVYRNLDSPSLGQGDKAKINLLLAAIFCLFVGNLTQPNFTYSQTGNLVFFLLGFVAVYKNKATYVRD